MIQKTNFTIYFKSSEDMSEIPDNSIDLYVSGSLYLGKTWELYKSLYQKLYLDQKRILKDDGYLVIQQTDAYVNNQVFLKSQKLINLLKDDYNLIDMKIWKRCKVNFFQFPYSYFFIFVKKENTSGRQKIKNKRYLRGIWDYPQTEGSELNSWNEDLCNMLVDSFTKKDDSILDPLAGTGMILSIGARKGRKCYGYEINKDLETTILDNYNKIRQKGVLDEFIDTN